MYCSIELFKIIKCIFLETISIQKIQSNGKTAVIIQLWLSIYQPNDRLEQEGDA
jgi:hypothetical protein